MWEITGNEFTKSDIHTAAGISVRFPRITRMRDDKNWQTATSMKELQDLYKASKEKADFDIDYSTKSSTADDNDDIKKEVKEEKLSVDDDDEDDYNAETDIDDDDEGKEGKDSGKKKKLVTAVKEEIVEESEEKENNVVNTVAGAHSYNKVRAAIFTCLCHYQSFWANYYTELSKKKVSSRLCEIATSRMMMYSLQVILVVLQFG